MARDPDSELARRVLPGPLYEALVHVFDQGIRGSMLVGGTALAGYYAGHRRSDDLDLFVSDASALTATVLAVESLRDVGASIAVQQSTKQYWSATCRLREHVFTVQVVLDSNLFAVGRAIRAPDNVHVAELETLLKTKAATLLSRCSEKDLYDLLWLFGEFPDLNVRELIRLGSEIDRGMSAEALLISLVGTRLSPESSDFSLSQDADRVFRDVSSLKKELTSAFEKEARAQPTPAIGELIRKLRS